jgi:acid phosphatase type 7
MPRNNGQEWVECARRCPLSSYYRAEIMNRRQFISSSLAAVAPIRRRIAHQILLFVVLVMLVPLCRPQDDNDSRLSRFVIYGDTRTNHKIHRQVVLAAVGQDPEFIVQTGDLVARANNLDQWRTFDRIIQPLREKHIGYYPARGESRCVIPFFHKAIFSVGDRHGSDMKLQPVLHPLFKQHGVRLVFQGHDHLYYRTTRDGIVYVVTGGGGAPLYHIVSSELQPGDIAKRLHHFCVADLFQDEIKVTVYAVARKRAGVRAIDNFVVSLKSMPN